KKHISLIDRNKWLKRALFENKVDYKSSNLIDKQEEHDINNNIIDDDIKEKSINWYYYTFIALPGTIFLLLCRAMSNVSTSAQGLDKALATLGIKQIFRDITILSIAITVLSLYGIVKLPVILLTMAVIGYVIKSANNCYKHYYNTLSIIFGV